jgi:hypothetical protein
MIAPHAKTEDELMSTDYVEQTTALIDRVEAEQLLAGWDTWSGHDG